MITLETGIKANVRGHLSIYAVYDAHNILFAKLTFYGTLGWKAIDEQNPKHFKTLDGQLIPVWVLTSTPAAGKT